MRRPSFRVRTILAAVVVVALLIWASMMGTRSYEYHGRSRFYAEQERAWREIAGRKRWEPKFTTACVEFFDGLTRKYRRASLHPWDAVGPDPWAPGAEEAYRSNFDAEGERASPPVTIPPMPSQLLPRIDPAHQKAPTKKEK